MDEGGGGGGNGCIFDRPRGMPKAGFEMKSFTISKGSQKQTVNRKGDNEIQVFERAAEMEQKFEITDAMIAPAGRWLLRGSV